MCRLAKFETNLFIQAIYIFDDFKKAFAQVIHDN